MSDSGSKIKLANFRRACSELGVEMIAPYDLRIGEGVELRAYAFLPTMGGASGMLLFHSTEDLQGMAPVLVELGYGYSVVEVSSDLPFSHEYLDGCRDMFRDWGGVV